MSNTTRVAVKLSGSELRALAKKIKDKDAEINKIAAKVVEMVLEDGLKFLKTQIPVDTGDLLNSANVRYSPGSLKGQLRVDSNHAIYVEYGTGIVGRNKGHPEADGSWYDKNNHGEKGWVYFDPGYGFVRTQGQVGQQFFYRTKLYMKERMKYWSSTLFKDVWKGM